MISRSLFLALTFVACSTSAHSMCGSKSADAATMQSKPANQCMGSMQGMDMPQKKDGSAAPDDPHAGMDMGDKSKGGMGCCSCCGDGSTGKSGGMCGKQASLVTEDGKNDPLLGDPMWQRKPGRE